LAAENNHKADAELNELFNLAQSLPDFDPKSISATAFKKNFRWRSIGREHKSSLRFASSFSQNPPCLQGSAQPPSTASTTI
jgi:hypothetical protein